MDVLTRHQGCRTPREPLSTARPTAKRGLLVFIALALWWTGCSKPHSSTNKNAAARPAVSVQVQKAESQLRPVVEEVVGTVRAKVRATLEAKVSGRIQAMPVRLGQSVKAGELVARLDAAEVQARLAQAKASWEQAERDWSRISSLFNSQAATRAERDNAEARHRVAQAALAEAEAMMRYAEVLAPFDGVVSRKSAEVGDQASPGKPLVELEDPSALQLEADLPESQAGRVGIGTRLVARVDGIGPDIPGSVSEIAPAADPASRTVRIKVDLPPTPGLMPGRFARLLVPGDETKTLTVPLSAVVERGQLEVVFVITNQAAQLHLVKTGRRSANSVEILSGLEAGEAVAVEGAAVLTDGQPVEVK